MAVTFDANTDKLSRTTGLPTITGFTMMGWFRITAHTDYQTFLCYGDTSGSTYYDFGCNASEATALWNGTGEDLGTTLTAGQWYHCAMTCAGTGAGQLNAYLDGVLEATLAGAAGVSAETISVGNDPSGEELRGDAAGIKIWDAVLTLAEIFNERRQILPIRTANLNSFYPLFSTADDEIDFSGNGRTWTVGGTLANATSTPPVPWCLDEDLGIYIPAAGAPEDPFYRRLKLMQSYVPGQVIYP